MKKKLFFPILLVLIALAGFTSIALGQDSTSSLPSDDAVNVIAKQLYCPVCENIPLDVCGTQACAQWRELIREKLAQGWTEAQIKQYFVDQYGDRVLAAPPARGLNWLVYLVPPVAILAGAFILYKAFLSWRQPPGAASPAAAVSEPGAPADEYIKRLEDELNKR